jgi:hypothetical protein
MNTNLKAQNYEFREIITWYIFDIGWCRVPQNILPSFFAQRVCPNPPLWIALLFKKGTAP